MLVSWTRLCAAQCSSARRGPAASARRGRAVPWCSQPTFFRGVCIAWLRAASRQPPATSRNICCVLSNPNLQPRVRADSELAMAMVNREQDTNDKGPVPSPG